MGAVVVQKLEDLEDFILFELGGNFPTELLELLEVDRGFRVPEKGVDQLLDLVESFFLDPNQQLLEADVQVVGTVIDERLGLFEETLGLQQDLLVQVLLQKKLGVEEENEVSEFQQVFFLHLRDEEDLFQQLLARRGNLAQGFFHILVPVFNYQ